ncbi:MAG TPA: polyprenyl synthetase family protein [Candidatus Limnocylindria bacterium]|nr:polyprenyl synthetase family protein [Candidatus Limnocylindria bacterium]
MDIRVEFSQMVADIEAEMQSILDEHRGPAAPMYDMLAYHLGLDGTDADGGKRIRPLLGLLVIRALGGDYHRALAGAAAVELGHNFSLVHDDIQDGDLERRHRATLWALWGVPQAINAGDALFALSRLALFRLSEAEDDPDAPDARQILDLMKIYDQTCLALCEGQFLDISFEARLDVTVEEYLQMIELKTASLMAAGVEAAATLTSKDPAVVTRLRRFGDRLGLAFQMADDVKGAFWDESASGKAEAGDVRRRKKTMPVIWALNHASEADQARLRELFTPGADGAQLTDAEVVEGLAILDRSGARETTLGEARRYRDEALAELETLDLEPGPRAELELFVEAVIAA